MNGWAYGPTAKRESAGINPEGHIMRGMRRRRAGLAVRPPASAGAQGPTSFALCGGDDVAQGHHETVGMQHPRGNRSGATLINECGDGGL
jgi:hypothetical protein